MQTRFFIVWGMHRAGTSALAEALSVFGIRAQGDVIAADAYNPTGYHESKELVALNDSMLSALNLCWSSLGQIDEYQTKCLEEAGALDAAIAFLRKQKGPNTLLKDPRMCKLGLLWQHAFQKLEIRPYSLVAWRNPLAVAQSLARRNAALALNRPVRDTRYGQLLWLSYTTASLYYTRPYKRLLIDYDRFLKNPASVLEAVAAKFDLANISECGHHKTGILNPELNHFEPDTGALLPGMVSNLYHLLKSCSDGETFLTSDSIELWPQDTQEKLLVSLLDEESRNCLDKQRELLKSNHRRNQPCPKVSS